MVLLDLGLAHAVESLVDFWKVRHPHITFGVDIGQESFGKVLDDAIYRIVREALSNALRHGTPDRIRIAVLEQSENIVAVEIADDGGGLESAEPIAGFGITGMQERVALLGGTLVVGNQPGGGGVIVTARFPGRSAGYVAAEHAVEELSA